MRGQSLYATDDARIEARSDALESRLAELRDSQAELLANIYERAESIIATLETTLALTGREIPRLIEKSQAARVGMAGPLLGFDARPSREAFEFDRGFETAVVRLERYLTRWEDLKDILRRVPLAAPTTSRHRSASARIR